MKLSALLVLVALTSTCVAQKIAARPIPSSDQNAQVGIVDDQALSRAAAAVGAAATQEELHRMMERLSQANCPVVLTSAWIKPYLMLLKTGDDSRGGSIDLEFRNTSGKEIRSMELSAQILVKKSVYDLGYLPPIYVQLTAYGTSSLDKTSAQLRHLTLPDGIHAALVRGVTLEQVTFSDGSVWTPANNEYCGVGPNQSLPVAR